MPPKPTPKSRAQRGRPTIAEARTLRGRTPNLTIRLEESTQVLLRAKAKASGVSVAEAVRRALDDYLTE